jgi:hypothetical protein
MATDARCPTNCHVERSRNTSHCVKTGIAPLTMAKIEDLIAQIPHERLKKAVGAEVPELKKNEKFGLVFEDICRKRFAF